MESLHRQVEVESPDGELIQVDEGIEPLVAALWQYGFETGASCESFPALNGYAYVGFTNETDRNLFGGAVQSITAGLILIGPDESISAEDAALHSAWAIGFPSEYLSSVTACVKRGGGPKVGRNDPCPCESGAKFKHCCAA